ncbi:MAG TPA: anaerobic ribonucleoside-triphosphate reductase activating protein [Clostridiales bacterium]|nr:anaerobic ribonucleoside-triphosphate reductase activating protein [Clostridiales bacterium]
MGSMLRIAGIERESIVDGPGIRFVVFAQGCKHRCRGCHNPQTHSFDGGTLVDIDEIMSMICKNPLLDGLTFSGGEPFEQAKTFAELAKMAKSNNLNIITYTGYRYEEIMEGLPSKIGWEDLLRQTDILIDGKFDIKQKSMLLKFRGSKNQRAIDVEQSLKQEKIVLAEL